MFNTFSPMQQLGPSVIREFFSHVHALGMPGDLLKQRLFPSLTLCQLQFLVDAGSALTFAGIMSSRGYSHVTMLILNKRPFPSRLGQNIPNGWNVICVPANRASPMQYLANNNMNLHIPITKHKCYLNVRYSNCLFEKSYLCSGYIINQQGAKRRWSAFLANIIDLAPY